jgi:hypothetical protein
MELTDKITPQVAAQVAWRLRLASSVRSCSMPTAAEAVRIYIADRIPITRPSEVSPIAVSTQYAVALHPQAMVRLALVTSSGFQLGFGAGHVPVSAQAAASTSAAR